MPIPTEKEVIQAVGGLPDPRELTAVLLAGGNPNAKVDGRTALDCAVMLGYEQKVRLLLSHGADPNVHEDPDLSNDGRFTTPLIDSARTDARVPILKALLEAGADPNQRDNVGMTALMYASLFGAARALAVLIENGAVATLETGDGQTALHFAMKRDNPEIVQQLISLGLDPEKSSGPRTPSPAALARKRNLTGTLQLLSALRVK
jgi:ankyrin repeat protein